MNPKNKRTTYSTIAVLLIISMTITVFATPTALNAQTTPPTIKTYPFVEAVPNPVGVNQRTLINFGLLNFLNQDGDGWNVTLTIKKPDGTTDEVGPLKTWSTGTVGHSFTPTEPGEYILQSHFAATWYNYTAYGVHYDGYYGASDSEEYVLTVKNESKQTYPSQLLPSEYWSRPIDSQLREWWSIAGSWVSAPLNLYAPYNDAPDTAHILWNMPIGDTNGGLMGGASGEHGYGIGDAYEGKFSSSVIIGGVLYYNKMGSPMYSTVPTQEVVAVDLHTGEILWSRNLGNANYRISFGQNLYWDCLNYRGGFSYLWVSYSTGVYPDTHSNLAAFETETGNWVLNYTDVPSGTNYWGPNGEFLRYSITNIGNATNPNWRLLRWNSSYVAMHGRTGMMESWGSAVQGMTFDARLGYDLNISVPADPASKGSIIYAFPGDRLIGGNVSSAGVTLWGLSLEPGKEGTVLFSNMWTAPPEWKDLTVSNSIGQAGWTAFSLEDMVATYWTKENRVSYAFSISNGTFLWETTPQDYKDAWSDTITLSFGPDKVIAYNKYYSASVAGIVYCYDIANGHLLWTYNATDKYTESYLGNTWWLAPLFVSDDKIYFGSLEHSPLDPKPRGAPFICLNATDGSLIWEADGLFRQTRWGGRAIIGDSIIATMDTYDQQIYAIGKGPTALTVTAPNTAVAANTKIVIQGTVTDISPGTQSDSLKMKFPNGVPAVSDEFQSDWMLYVYKQFSQPSDVTGVKVSIDAISPSGEYVHLGDATSDYSGTYSFVWTPSEAGTYIVHVTFGGSGAYYSSFAQTAMVIQEATATPTTTTQQSITEQYFVPAIVGIIVVVIIVGALLAFLMLKKRP